MANDAVARNRAQYLAWLRGNFPELYYQAIGNARDASRGPGMSGIFDSIGNAFTSVVSDVTKALPSLAQTYSQHESQKNLLAANTQRAAQGLAPLQYNAAGQLVTAGGLPYTAADYQLALRGGTGSSSTTLLLLGGGALLLLVFFISSNRR